VSPIVFFVILYLVNPEIVDLLITDPTGHKLLAYAATSVLVGTLVIRWMIRRDTAL
jgi:tight adherence protein B